MNPILVIDGRGGVFGPRVGKLLGARTGRGERDMCHWIQFCIQYKLEFGILDNGIKLEYGIQMRATGIFTT